MLRLIQNMFPFLVTFYITSIHSYIFIVTQKTDMLLIVSDEINFVIIQYEYS